MTDLKPNEYRCSACREVFEKGLTDEEAAAQLGEEFPGYEPDDCDLVCEDCFQKYFGHLTAKGNA